MNQISTERKRLINQLATLLCSIDCPHPLRVAIDGVDGAGKTYLADELVKPIEDLSRKVIRTSIDRFHFPQEIRYKRGQGSPEGYYRDSFDYDAVINLLLKPLGPGGDRRYRQAVYDYVNEKTIHTPLEVAPKDAILLFDGIFLLRPELKRFWDFSIFVDVNFDVCVERAVTRDVMLFKGAKEISNYHLKYQQRYIPGQRLYFQEAKPKDIASLIMDNNNLSKPYLIEK